MVLTASSPSSSSFFLYYYNKLWMNKGLSGFLWIQNKTIKCFKPIAKVFHDLKIKKFLKKIEEVFSNFAFCLNFSLFFTQSY